MKVSLDATRDIASQYMVTVCIVGMREFHIRLWIAKQLLKLVAVIANTGIKFEQKPYYSADL